MTRPIVPTFTPYTVRHTWHHGNERRVTDHSAPYITDALALAIAADPMPDQHFTAALAALHNGDVYAGWSWSRFELIAGSPTKAVTDLTPGDTLASGHVVADVATGGRRYGQGVHVTFTDGTTGHVGPGVRVMVHA